MQKNLVACAIAIIAAAVITACIDDIPANPFLRLPGSTEQNNAAKVHAALPVIAAHPQDAVYSHEGAATALTVHAEVDDGGTLSYRWYRDETIIPDETEASYTPPTDTVSIVYYYVEVTNTITDNGDGGNKTATTHSHTARIEVNEKINAAIPHIAAHPQGVEYTYGDTAEALTVSVEVTHDGTLSYQWYGNEINSDEGGTESPDATEESYTPPVGNAGEVHYYYVIITNTIEDNGDGGNKSALICSDPAEVTVKPRPLTISFKTELSPINTTALVIVSNVTVDGLIAPDTVTVSSINNITNLPTGLTLSGNTITYNGTTAFANSAVVTVNVTTSAGSNYTVGSTMTIQVCDGQANYTGSGYDRRIPVNSTNIAAFNTYANTTNGLTRHYKLTGNVTLSGTNNWTAIGTWETSFAGSFNGQGNTITGLNINKTTEDYQGMFGFIRDGMVQNLGLVGGSVNGRANVGGVAGRNYDGTVQNCYVTSSVSGRTFYMDGSAYSATGGVVGENEGGIVQNCYATGNVSDGNTGSVYVGGVVGKNNRTVQNCYATGNVSGGSNSSGVSGVVGGSFGTVQNCVALNPSVNGGGRVTQYGGDVYNNYARSTGMTLNYTPTSDLNGKDGLSTSAYNTQSFYTTASNWRNNTAWDFTNVWQWNSTTNLPVLRGFNQAQNHTVP